MKKRFRVLFHRKKISPLDFQFINDYNTVHNKKIRVFLSGTGMGAEHFSMF